MTSDKKLGAIWADLFLNMDITDATSEPTIVLASQMIQPEDEIYTAPGHTFHTRESDRSIEKESTKLSFSLEQTTNWWRNQKHVIVAVIFATCFILAITMSVLYGNSVEQINALLSQSNQTSTGVSNNTIFVVTEEYKKYNETDVVVASRLLSYADFFADPCQDFYQYACGEFNTRHHLDNVNTFTFLQDQRENEIERILGGERTSYFQNGFLKQHPSLSTIYNDMMKYYETCTNILEANKNTFLSSPSTNTDIGSQMMAYIVNSISVNIYNTSQVDFPMATWLAYQLNLSPALLFSFRELEALIFGILNFSVELDYQPAPTGILKLSPARPLLQDVPANQRFSLTRSIVRDLLLPGSSLTTYTSVTNAIVAFDASLALLNTTPTDLVKYVSADAASAFSRLFASEAEWNYFLSLVGVREKYLSVAEIHTDTPRYFTELSNLLNQTPASTVQHYIGFVTLVQLCLVSQMQGILTGLYFSDLPLGFNRDPVGTVFRKPLQTAFTKKSNQSSPILKNVVVLNATNRNEYQLKFEKKNGLPSVGGWKREFCMQDVVEKFAPFLARVYKESRFTDKILNDVDNMVVSIKRSFLERVQSTILEPWLDSPTRARAVRKINNMPHVIGLPQYLLDTRFLGDYYEDLIQSNLDSVNLLDNALLLLKVTNRAWFRFVYDVPVSKMYLMSLTDLTIVNAFYIPALNEMLIPMGILDVDFLSSSYKALQYGTVGMIIGHEITHGFDVEGIQYDEYGRYQLGTTVPKGFVEQSACFQEFYGRYLFNGVPVRNETLSENIADNGGLKLSFSAFQTSRRLSSSGSIGNKMAGLENVDENKIFWLSYAQMWCTANELEYDMGSMTQGVHALYKFRVNAALALNEEFADTFTCKDNTPMRPRRNDEQTCILWR